LEVEGNTKYFLNIRKLKIFDAPNIKCSRAPKFEILEVNNMSKKVVEVKTLKVGKYVILDGEASKIKSIQTYLPTDRKSVV